LKRRHRGCDDKPLVWTLCVEASIGTVPPFRARKGGQVEVLGTASEGEAPIDKKGNQEKTVRQLAAWQGIPEGEGPPGAD
jgi:hypothetical protein